MLMEAQFINIFLLIFGVQCYQHRGYNFQLDERHVIKNEKVALDRLRVRQNVFLVLSIHFFGGLLLFLLSSIRDTWPNQVSLLLLILSTIVSFCCKVSLISIFFIVCLLVVIQSIFLSQVISTVRIFFLSSLRRHQHSDPYSNTGTTNVSYLTLDVFDTSLAFHILLNFPAIVDANPIRLFYIHSAFSILCH